MRATASRRWLWTLIAAGTAIRVAIAFATYGQVFDMGSYQVVRHAIAEDREALEDALLVRGEERPGVGEGRPHALVARGDIAQRGRE